MDDRRKLPMREQVFLEGLRYHGFKLTYTSHNLKFRNGYVIPTTKREDSGGVDFWVKLPRQIELVPVQVTQRGTKLHRKYHRSDDSVHNHAEERANARLRQKRELCRKHRIAFVLVRDYDGERLHTSVAWGDKKALLNGVRQLQPA